MRSIFKHTAATFDTKSYKGKTEAEHAADWAAEDAKAIEAHKAKMRKAAKGA